MRKIDSTERSRGDGKLRDIYRGVVEDNLDPELRGRVRARIWGRHTDKKVKTLIEGIPTAELPWAEPCLPIMEGGISGFGTFGVPVQGSHVMMFFENGHPSQPRYFASMPGVPNTAADPTKGFNDPNGVYPSSFRLGEPDWHKLARGDSANTLVTTKNSLRDSIEPVSPYAAQYPHNWVIATHGGVTIELDSTPGNERINIYHPSNSYIEIDKDGNMVIKSNSNKIEVVNNNKKKHVKGNEEDTIDGDLTITVTGNVNITATGAVNVIGDPINLN